MTSAAGPNISRSSSSGRERTSVTVVRNMMGSAASAGYLTAPDLGASGDIAHAVQVSIQDVLVEQGTGRHLGHTSEEVIDIGYEYDPGFGTELARPEGDRACEPGGDLVRTMGPAARGDDDGVGAAQLAVERDRVGPGVGEVEEGAAACGGAGEGDRLDPWVPHRIRCRPALPRRHRTLRRVRRRRQCRGDDGGGPPGQLGMPGMSLDHHGAARGERAHRVPAGNAEREREVARREHEDGPKCNMRATQVRPRPRRPIAIGAIDRRMSSNVTLGQPVAEQPCLERGAPHLPGEPRLGQMGLRDRARHEVRGGGIEGIGDRAQPVRRGWPRCSWPWAGPPLPRR